MLKFLSPWMICFLAIVIFAGCRHSVRETQQPVIYDAWNARYEYDPLTRKMYSVSQGQQVGLSWSRDTNGRIDSLHFYSGSDGIGGDESLIEAYRAKMDRKRDSTWEAERETRILQVREQIANLDSNKSSDSEVVPEESTLENSEDTGVDPFLPIPDIPGLDQTETAPSPDNGNEVSPFLPIAPEGENAGDDSLPPLP